ncbi:MAG: [LysW]-lysine hydrolase [Trueperaceae bacterium]|nr:MAG: [LysW]-lysine hydrolase [Trueperaceae bacterium]
MSPEGLEAVDFLRRVVEIPSPSGREARLARYLAEQLDRYADEVFVDEVGNAVARWGRGPLNVTFLGHIDTAPGAIPVRLYQNSLYGRGSVDAKGALCAAIVAMSRLQAEVLERLTVTVIGAVEEEAPSSRGARYAIETYGKPDLVIIGEPSGWDAVTLGYKGRLVLTLEQRKQNFHSAGNDTTAAEDIVSAWEIVRAWAEKVGVESGRVFDRIQASLQDICSQSDGLYQSAKATVGFRLPLTVPPHDAIEQLRPLVVERGLSCRFSGGEAAYKGDRDSRLARAFRVAIRQSGVSPRQKVKTGTSDMNVVAPVWDGPMLAYGPGDSSLDHTPDEHLPVEDYLKSVSVLVGVMNTLAGI